MLGIDLVSDKTTKEPLALAQRVFEICIKKGLVIRPIVNLIVISPPLTLTEQEVDSLLSIVKSAIIEASNER